MMGQVVSIEDFRRQRLDRQLKKRLKAAQSDLAEAYGAQRDLIDELRRACWPTDEEERILHTMERVAGVMELRLEYLTSKANLNAMDDGEFQL